MKFVAFDVFADLAQFKKPFTTMSPQTFSFPTGTAAIGIIAAILGLDKNEYWTYFPPERYVLSLGVLKPIKKIVIPINLLKTTQPKHFYRFENHKPTNVEFVKEAGYRIYFHYRHEDLFEKLAGLLRRHESVYSVSLGQAGNLADVVFSGLWQAEQVSGPAWAEICSVIPAEEVQELDFSDLVLFSHRIPVRMKPEEKSREVTCYREYLFERDARKIRAKVNFFWRLDNGECIIPL